jgi:Domain of unknown function (DUF1874)
MQVSHEDTMRYIGNAFSAGMLTGNSNISFAFITQAEASAWMSGGPCASCVGHADTALLISSLLGVCVPMRRISTELHAGDELLVAQYNGPRLLEGATALPEGAQIRWILAKLAPVATARKAYHDILSKREALDDHGCQEYDDLEVYAIRVREVWRTELEAYGLTADEAEYIVT